MTIINNSHFKAVPKEILTIIFSYLELKDLERIRRVCKTWNHHIVSESALWVNLGKSLGVRGLENNLYRSAILNPIRSIKHIKTKKDLEKQIATFFKIDELNKVVALKYTSKSNPNTICYLIKFACHKKPCYPAILDYTTNTVVQAVDWDPRYFEKGKIKKTFYDSFDKAKTYFNHLFKDSEIKISIIGSDDADHEDSSPPLRTSICLEPVNGIFQKQKNYEKFMILAENVDQDFFNLLFKKEGKRFKIELLRSPHYREDASF